MLICTTRLNIYCVNMLSLDNIQTLFCIRSDLLIKSCAYSEPELIYILALLFCGFHNINPQPRALRYGIESFAHLKLCLATVTHNYNWVVIR